MADDGTGLREHRKGLLTTGLGALLFTWDIPLLRLAGADQWTMIFSRGLFMFTAISLWWVWSQRRTGSHRPFIDGKAGLLVALTSTLANLLFISAITKTTAANLVFILALNPIFCAILAWLFLGERAPLGTWIAAVLALLGVGIIVSDGLTTGTFTGDVMALGVALCMAVVLTTVRKTRKNVVTSLASGSLFAALIASLFATPAAMPLESWGWVALNGLIVIPLATGLVAIGPRYLPSAEVAMFFLLDTVLTPVWVWMLFGELATLQSFIGGGIVITTLAVHAVWRYRVNGAAHLAYRQERSEEA